MDRDMTTSHAVQFYEDDVFLVESVSDFVKAGLREQETVIIVATLPHRTDLMRILTADPLIGSMGLLDHHYVPLDASDTLSLFMVNGWPDERIFLNAIGKIIQAASQGRPVRIFGEMVAVLWAEGRHQAAIRLEKLWNELIEKHAFSLLCAYPSRAFENPDMAESFRDVCACHSHVAPSGTELPDRF